MKIIKLKNYAWQYNQKSNFVTKIEGA